MKVVNLIICDYEAYCETKIFTLELLLGTILHITG
jgi:hypothetical protein